MTFVRTWLAASVTVCVPCSGEEITNTSVAVFVSPGTSADEYDEKSSGHPLRIVAYVLHPVGVAIDYLLLRPAHWLGSHEPLKTIFGHED